MEPTVGMAAELRTDPASLATDAQSVARGLHRLVEGDLAGMFDGESTATVDWSGPGIVVDLSAVLQSPAFSSILVCAGAWLAQVVARKDRQRIIVVDECWKAIRDAGFVAWGEETQKLSRGYGVQFVTIVQRISDLASQADDGTATAKRAQGFVTEAETKVTFNLSGGEAKASRDVMDWTESETLLVPRLPRGRALWRVGEHGAIVQTILSPRDMAMCDSNQAMRSHRMTDLEERPRLTWSRLGIGISIGLVLFGAIDAALPHSTRPSRRISGVGPQETPDSGDRNGRPHRWCRGRTAQPNGWPRSSSRPPTPPIRHTPRATQPSEPHWPQAWPCRDEWRGRRPGWRRTAGRRWCSTRPVPPLRSVPARLPWSSPVGRS